MSGVDSLIDPVPSQKPIRNQPPDLPPRPTPPHEAMQPEEPIQSQPPIPPHGSVPQQQSVPLAEGTSASNSPVDMPSESLRPSIDDEEGGSNCIPYSRDPSRLIAYLIPFPAPLLENGNEWNYLRRFLVYTPPGPPLKPPEEGEKEGKRHKLQRRWESEIREAKTNPHKRASWRGVKGRAEKGIDKAMNWIKSSTLEFLIRVPTGKANAADERTREAGKPFKVIRLQEIVLIHPESMGGSQEEIKEEFIHTLLRAKNRSQRDSVISTLLFPVGLAVDLLLALVWPFGGLAEIDAVWAYASIRGAITARKVTKRLDEPEKSKDGDLELTLTASPRLEVLSLLLEAECHKRNAKRFPQYHTAPTQEEALRAIAWATSETPGAKRTHADEQWEISEAKDDMKQVMHKAAREWDRWCKAYEKNSVKALKK